MLWLKFDRCLAIWVPFKDSVKAFEGLRPSFSAHVRSGEHGAPVLFPFEFVCGGGPGVESPGFPYLTA